jgi:hypothetical protein
MTAILEKRERRGQAGRQALVNARVTDSFRFTSHTFRLSRSFANCSPSIEADRMKRGIPLYKNPVTDERLPGRVSKIPDASVTVTFRLEDVKKLKNGVGKFRL